MAKDKVFDPTDVGKMFASYSFPGLDVEALMATQRKNLEAFTQANQLAADGFQALAKKHAELMRAAVDEMSALVREWTETAAPEQKLEKQAEFAKEALAKGMSNTRELIELARKSQTEAFEVLSKRFKESLDEMASLARKRAKPE
jgi:phasin family protein